MLKTTLDYANLYGAMHAKYEKYFAGKVRGIDVVVDLVKKTKPRNLLDYGSGRGYQYLVNRQHEAWGGVLPYCYDVGVRQLRQRPEGTFDGILCCDMMEHIDEADVDVVLTDIFGFSAERRGQARSFVYFHISCIPSIGKTLPDGRNVHLTQKPPEWWNERLRRFERSGLVIEARYETTTREDRRPC